MEESMTVEEVGMTKSERYEHGKLLRIAINHETISEWVRQDLEESLEAIRACRDSRAMGDGVANYSHGYEEDLRIMDEVIYAYRIILGEYSVRGENVCDIMQERGYEFS